jgi:UrcA family protein
MFTPLLLALAIATTSPMGGDIVVIDDQPTITIPLDRLDLARAEDVSRARHMIRHAAMRVCDRGYRGISYLETVACVKGAIADGNAQLSRIQALDSSKTSVTAAIAVTAPSN